MASHDTTPKATAPVTLSSPRLLLRRARLEDAEHLHVAFSDPEVMKYWSTLPHETLAQTEEWVRGMTAAACNGVTDFIVCLRTPDGGGGGGAALPIGKAGVWRDNEIGFMLARPHWGRGLAAEALTLVLDHLLTPAAPAAPGLGVVVADVDPRNEPSLRLLRRLGFEVYDSKLRTFQIGGAWVDSTYLRLSRTVWEERKKGTLSDDGA